MADIFDDLTPEERKILRDIFGSATDIQKELLDSRQVREIVPIKKWLESEYYVGPDYARIYDYWKDELADIFEYQNKYHEVIIDGAIGTGKSSVAELMLLRKIYELSCFTNIPAMFGLMCKTKLVFLYFSLTKIQAERTGYGEMRELIDSSPYFQKEFSRDKNFSSILVWPTEKLLLIHGSNASHAIGMSVIGAVLDEANFFGGESTDANAAIPEYSRVASVYANIIQRAQSRFMRNGVNSSLSILVSSSTHANSFTERRKKLALTDPGVKYIQTKLWQVKPKGTYSTKKFYVCTGSDTLDPFIVENVEDINHYCSSVGLPLYDPDYVTIPLAVDKLPPEHRQMFVSIPEDFRPSFDADLLTALQNIAGVSIAPLGRLFSSRPLFTASCREGESLGLQHPFTKNEITISTGEDITLDRYIKPGFTFINPEKKRYLHIDQSTSRDNTGIACCHVSEVRVVDGIQKPVIAIDFMLRIPPPRSPKKISISKVRDFVFYLRDRFKLQIGHISYDTFGSQESVQVLQEAEISCKFQSVDRTDQAYLALTNLYYEERIIQYDYSPYKEELFQLIHDREKRKVDHPPQSSKDVADAVAGAVYNALQSPLADAISTTEGIAAFVEANNDSFSDDDEFFPVSWLMSNE